MNCDRALEALLPFSVGGLDEPEASVLADHLAACPRCAARRRRLMEAFERAAPPIASPAGAWGRILELGRERRAEESAVAPRGGEAIGTPVADQPRSPSKMTEAKPPSKMTEAKPPSKMTEAKPPPKKAKRRVFRIENVVMVAVLLIFGNAARLQIQSFLAKRSADNREEATLAAERPFGAALPRYFALYDKAGEPDARTLEARARWREGLGKMVVLQTETRGLSSVQLEMPISKRALDPKRAEVLVVLSFDWNTARRRGQRRTEAERKSFTATFIDLASGSFLGKTRGHARSRRGRALLSDRAIAEELARRIPWSVAPPPK